MKETVIITPAENAKAKVISFLFCDLEKKIINAPKTVDIPAMEDKSKGITDRFSNIIFTSPVIFNNKEIDVKTNLN
ncbi:hypothetical protein CPJCM30710_03960 [Clostridium polyendosporum]|uniref:Uncharacterized protein n=1 Tax=Clostridium polyendosporum TaxID=69208 RepID=A0A919RYF3_9CLOT|nr:hypothetical protein CPJCM30710_03960 [Clostridium polyendosporum]